MALFDSLFLDEIETKSMRLLKTDLDYHDVSSWYG
jgi:hypothetical protein